MPIARGQVVHMYAEGWQQQSMANCLLLSRKHVAHILAAFERDGLEGLEDHRSRPPDHPANQLTLPLLKAVIEVPREYRRGALSGAGPLEPAPTRICPAKRHHSGAGDGAQPAGPWRSRPWVTAKPHPPQESPAKQPRYKAEYRHQYWFVDLRYLVQLDGHWAYSICILERYSRQSLVGMASAYQDSVAILQLLCAPVGASGCPWGSSRITGPSLPPTNTPACWGVRHCALLYRQRQALAECD